MFQKRTLGVIVSLLMLTTACGQKGDLYLPKQKPAADEVKQQQNDEPKENQQKKSNNEKPLSESDGHMP